MSKSKKADSRRGNGVHPNSINALKNYKGPYRWKKGQSGNPGGKPKKFTSQLSDALRDKLGEISPEKQQPYAVVIADLMVEKAAAEVEKFGITRQVLTFFKEARDSTEGKPLQKIAINGTPTTDDDERIRELIAEALERSAG